MCVCVVVVAPIACQRVCLPHVGNSGTSTLLGVATLPLAAAATATARVSTRRQLFARRSPRQRRPTSRCTRTSWAPFTCLEWESGATEVSRAGVNTWCSHPTSQPTVTSQRDDYRSVLGCTCEMAEQAKCMRNGLFSFSLWESDRLCAGLLEAV